MLKHLTTIAFGIFSTFLIVIMSLYPELIIESSMNGLKLWIESVFPSLFPFLILINIVTYLGIVDFIGSLLTPIISILFGVKGVGAMPLVAGFTSGYPVGAKLTCQLYNDNRLSKKCASKVICYSNNSGPLFIVGSVGVGMFHNVMVGYFILLVHIISAITLGILINIYTYEKIVTKKENILKKSCKAFLLHIHCNKKTLGEILSLSVSSSINTIVAIGGYIVLFSVIITSLQILNFNSLLPSPLLQSLFYGGVEMTNGVFIASSIGTKLSVILSCAIISFGGFSIHAQAISFISKTDLCVWQYLLGKFLCGLLSLLYGFLLYPFFNFSIAEPVFFQHNLNLPSINYYYISLFIIIIYFLIKKESVKKLIF